MPDNSDISEDEALKGAVFKRKQQMGMSPKPGERGFMRAARQENKAAKVAGRHNLRPLDTLSRGPAGLTTQAPAGEQGDQTAWSSARADYMEGMQARDAGDLERAATLLWKSNQLYPSDDSYMAYRDIYGELVPMADLSGWED